MSDFDEPSLTTQLLIAGTERSKWIKRCKDASTDVLVRYERIYNKPKTIRSLSDMFEAICPSDRFEHASAAAEVIRERTIPGYSANDSPEYYLELLTHGMGSKH